MKSIPRYGLIIGLLFLSGCAKQPEYNTRTALSTEVATRWGSDVHSTVKGVSAERVDSHPDEIVLINYSGQYQTGFDQRYSIRNSDLEYAVRDANFNSLPITRSYNNSTGNGNTPLRPALVLSINYMSVITVVTPTTRSLLRLMAWMC